MKINIPKSLLKFWNLWPPFLFSGIKIKKIAKDYREAYVKLKLRFWNCNYVGTTYGGAMFSMADPFYMLMLIKNLGPEYTVWDKAARIRYLKPGRTDLTAHFKITEEDLNSIRSLVEEQGKIEWTRTVEIKDKSGEVVAEVEKVISIKKKKPS
jgi:acyl-coenzyme A thioesterase PaaI-like protein